VKDGGNKSGIPTVAGTLYFDASYLGKCLVFVGAVGLMPRDVQGEPGSKKTARPGDLILMCGGRVGKDGIHGVTASSEVSSPGTPAAHVQIGDPYTQKKMHDFLLEARDLGLINFITDCGGGGLSSALGESAQMAGGAEVWLEKVPLKYAGLDPWEIWISESQERMVVGISPDNQAAFQELARKHEVEVSVIGRYTDLGVLQVSYQGQICAHMDLALLKEDFPPWEFEAEWLPPEQRLREPVLGEIEDHQALLLAMLDRPNLSSREWITRQYDHEVQGASVVKPLVGRDVQVPADAVVMRPRLDADKGLALSLALNPAYSQIDAYHMTAVTIDEAVRRLVAVGASLEHIGGVDNFCWPSIEHHPEHNPDGKYKAAQLVRSCWALRDLCQAYPDLRRVVTLDLKAPGDLIYVIGETRPELGGSEFYELLGYVGKSVPEVRPLEFLSTYRLVEEAIREGLLASCHTITRGGLMVHLALVSMAAGLGVDVEVGSIAPDYPTHAALYSESAGRFLVSAAPEHRERLEALFHGQPLVILGEVRPDQTVLVKRDGLTLMATPLNGLSTAWQRRFGSLI
jgi:phosphoribosylformylglycinamidine synthase